NISMTQGLMQGTAFAGLGLCLVYQQLDNEIKELINQKYGKEILEISKLNTKIINSDYFKRNQIKNEFNTLIDSQYYDDNISVRLIEDQILFYKIFKEIGPK